MDNLSREDFEAEPSEQWLGYLTDEQFEAIDNLLLKILNSDDFQFHLVIGVAGTGKTQVLLSLARDLRDANVSVIHVMEPSLKRFLERSGIQVRSDKSVEGAVVLLDDPLTLSSLKKWYLQAKERKARAFVVAVDPFQFQERKALLKFATYLHPEMATEEYRKKSQIMNQPFKDVIYSDVPQVHWLKTVYRQQANVGRQALELSQKIVSANNPWILESKQREWNRAIKSQIEGALTDITFVADGGFVNLVQTARPELEIAKAVAKSASRPNRWTETESFLVVCDSILLATTPNFSGYRIEENEWTTPPEYSWDDAIKYFGGEVDPSEDLSENQPFIPLTQTLREQIKRAGGKSLSYDESQSVRGIEFQDVIIHMTKAEFQYVLSSKLGANTEIWHRIMPLHTFMTRAKAQLTLIVS